MARLTTTPLIGKADASLLETSENLRASEKLILAFLAYAAFAAAVFPLSARERLLVLCLNFVSASAVLGLSRRAAEKPGDFIRTLHDWFPSALLLLAYRESGLFFAPDPAHRLDAIFVCWDSTLLNHPWTMRALSAGSPWLQYYFELFYFLCYPLVPLGLASIVLARRYQVLDGIEAERAIDAFWTTILLAVLSCYVLYPLFPLTPPRILFHDFPGPPVRPLFRNMNIWILGQYGVQACIFPSGHVAAVTATALAVRARLPRIGAAFAVAAVSVAVATVIGRYHYSVDAVAGALVGLGAYLVARRIHRSNRT